jgi:hypothetical protein
MRASEARALGQVLLDLVRQGDVPSAYAQLSPILAERTPFRLLDLIGDAVGECLPGELDHFLRRVASSRAEGGWVIIGSALRRQISPHMASTLARCRSHIVTADVWYGADILGERVPGPCLLADLDRALDLLTMWRTDENRWVRRAVGVAAHFWAKRTRGAPDCQDHAQQLLDFLGPMFSEWDMDAVKGVGWGLKTLGRCYPAPLSAWLSARISGDSRYRALVLRKALTYLPEEARREIECVRDVTRSR